MIASPNSLPRAIAVRANPSSNSSLSESSNSNLPAPVLDALAQATPFPSAELSRLALSNLRTLHRAERRADLADRRVGRDLAAHHRHRPARKRLHRLRLHRRARDRRRAGRDPPDHAKGAPLEGSVRLLRREIARGEAPLTSIPDGVLASRSLSMGQLIERTRSLRDPNGGSTRARRSACRGRRPARSRSKKKATSRAAPTRSMASGLARSSSRASGSRKLYIKTASSQVESRLKAANM